jgi:hypothetical protein
VSVSTKDHITVDGALPIGIVFRATQEVRHRSQATVRATKLIFRTLQTRAAFSASLVAFRFLAAARDAFFARAARSSGVMVFSERLPPISPPLRPISRMAWRKMARVLASTEAS